MAIVLAVNWWALALPGALALIFGLATLFVPGVTLAALVLMFGGYALVDGVLSVLAAFAAPDRGGRGGRSRFTGWCRSRRASSRC